MNRAMGLIVARGWMNVCALVSFVFVGQFLQPAEFGYFAVASSIVILAVTVIGAGFTEHVIGRDPDGRDEAAAFWCSAALGLLGTVLAILAGVVAEKVLSSRDVSILLFMLSPGPAMWGLVVISEAILVRDNRGGALAAILFVAETVGLATLVVALMLNAGIYALPLSRLANGVVGLMGYFAAARPRVSGAILTQPTMDMIRFSLGIAGTRLVNWANGYGTDLLLAVVLAPAGLGQYRMAARLVGAPSAILIQAPGQAQLAYAGERAAHAPERLGRALLRTVQLHWSLAAPLFVLVAIAGPDLVGLFLSSEWSGTGPIVAVFAAGALLMGLEVPLGIGLVVSGRSGLLFIYQTVCAVVSTVVLVAAATFGPLWAAIGKVLAGALLALYGLMFVLQLPARMRDRLLMAGARITVAALICGAVALSVSTLIPRPDGLVPALARIGAIGLAGLTAYCLALPFASRPAWLQVTFTLRKALEEQATLGRLLPTAAQSLRERFRLRPRRHLRNNARASCADQRVR